MPRKVQSFTDAYSIGQQMVWKRDNQTYTIFEKTTDTVRLKGNDNGNIIAFFPELTDMSCFAETTA